MNFKRCEVFFSLQGPSDLQLKNDLIQNLNTGFGCIEYWNVWKEDWITSNINGQPQYRIHITLDIHCFVFQISSFHIGLSIVNSSRARVILQTYYTQSRQKHRIKPTWKIKYLAELPSKFHPEWSWCPKSCSSWKLWSNFPYENISQSIYGILPSEFANAKGN